MLEGLVAELIAGEGQLLNTKGKRDGGEKQERASRCQHYSPRRPPPDRRRCVPQTKASRAICRALNLSTLSGDGIEGRSQSVAEVQCPAIPSAVKLA
jgi:hypothetical protein